MKTRMYLITAGLLTTLTIVCSAHAESLNDALIGGTPKLNVRLRYEQGNLEGKESSNALTVRTRLGYGTKARYGLRAYKD